MKGKIFNAQEVQAIISENKTQFREVIKPQPIQPESFSDAYFDCYNKGNQWNWWTKDHKQLLGQIVKCPYQVGQKIFCKEAFLQKIGSTQLPSGEHETFFTSSAVEYAADGAQERWDDPDVFYPNWWKKRPAQHMKQEHSRLTLQIKEIKVEHLGDISEEDAIAEGFAKITKDGSLYKFGIPDKDNLPGNNDIGWSWCDWKIKAKDAFAKLWNATHKKPEEKFESNPWVFVYQFELIK